MTTYYGLRLKTNGTPMTIEAEERYHWGGEICGVQEELTPAMGWIENLYLCNDKDRVEYVRTNTNNGRTKANFNIPYHNENPDDLEIFEVNI